MAGENSELVKVGHSGATLGGMSHVYYYPKAQSYIVVLTNTILEENIELVTDWAGSTVTNSGTDYLMDRLETLIL